MEELILVNGKPIEKGRVNGHVYIIQREDGALKIGKASNPTGRIKQISSLGGFEIQNKFISERCGNPYEIENILHNVFKENNISGEWFDVPFDEAVFEMKKLEFKPIEYEKEKSEEEKLRDEEFMKSMFPPRADEISELADEERSVLLENSAKQIVDYVMNKIEDKFYLIPKK